MPVIHFIQGGLTEDEIRSALSFIPTIIENDASLSTQDMETNLFRLEQIIEALAGLSAEADEGTGAVIENPSLASVWNRRLLSPSAQRKSLYGAMRMATHNLY